MTQLNTKLLQQLADDQTFDIAPALRTLARHVLTIEAWIEAATDTAPPVNSLPPSPLQTHSTDFEDIAAAIGKPATARLQAAGYPTVDSLRPLTDQQLSAIDGIGPATLRKLRHLLDSWYDK